MSNEVSITAKPRRRKWKRRMIVSALLICIVGWLVFRQPPEIEGSRTVRIGQAKVEVEAIVSEWIDSQYEIAGPILVVDNADTQEILSSGWLLDSRQRKFRALAATIEQWTGWRMSFGVRSTTDFDSWPVHIRFDRNGRVDRIKRGHEIIEAPPSAEAGAGIVEQSGAKNSDASPTPGSG